MKSGEFVMCDLCSSIVCREYVTPISVTVGDSVTHAMVCSRCTRREQEGPGKYIKKGFKQGRVWPSPVLEKNFFLKMLRLALELRMLLQAMSKMPLKSPQPPARIRDRMISKLEAAIDDAHERAKDSSVTAEKGRPDKVRYYQLMATMCGVLNRVLEGVQIDELAGRLDNLEAFIRKVIADRQKSER